jgi:hypothetical protein
MELIRTISAAWQSGRRKRDFVEWIEGHNPPANRPRRRAGQDQLPVYLCEIAAAI